MEKQDCSSNEPKEEEEKLVCPSCGKEINHKTKLIGLSIICPTCSKPL